MNKTGRRNSRYFAFAGKNQELKEAQETLRSDPEEKIELPRAYVYVWNNKLANQVILRLRAYAVAWTKRKNSREAWAKNAELAPA